MTLEREGAPLHLFAASPLPSPASPTAAEEQKRSSRLLSAATLHNHLNNLSTMAARTPQSNEEDDEDVDFDLRHLSFENPNYHMIDPARLDDHLNSNLQPSISASLFEELRLQREMEAVRAMLLESRKDDNRLAESESDKLVSEDISEKSVVVKMRMKKNKQCLPSGWERHEDDQGCYFWHVKSGAIQRDPPTDAILDEEAFLVKEARSSRIFEDDDDCGSKLMTRSCTINSMAELARVHQRRSPAGETKWKRKSLPPLAKSHSEEATSLPSLQVQVLSLGWVELTEEELLPENSSKSVNKCIVQLSTEVMEATEKELTLELTDGSLRLVQSDQLLSSQPIHSIRVWGVGRDNGGQDFAYVARDKVTCKQRCHVFKCLEQQQARAIANALRDICKKMLIERRVKSAAQQQSTAAAVGRKKDRLRPTDFSAKLQTRTVPAPESFPTPMEEPKKVLKAWYLGALPVSRPCGVDVINDAIDKLVSSIASSDWKTVTVAVAPSTISVSFGGDGSSDVDCRVRFLSFLGIGEKSPQQCAFIMHTAQDTFVAHVFHCEPTAGPLCKTVEAACKMRYQKCLDARQPQQQTTSTRPTSAIGTALKTIFGSWAAAQKSPN